MKPIQISYVRQLMCKNHRSFIITSCMKIAVSLHTDPIRHTTMNRFLYICITNYYMCFSLYFEK